ncbi:MAG TPA: branched-chain amino acid ABC transporter substrate-binding protein [Chloroflexia bacterium]
MRPRSPRFNTVEVVLPMALALAVGVALLFLLAPGLGFGKTADAGVIRIYSSVPMNGFASITHGVQMALDEAGGRAGNFRIDYVPLNGAKEIGGKWDAEVELANARRAAEDPDAMIYIGTYNSGAAKISIPVLNRVNMAMISPGNTYPGLTKPGTGTAGEPWTYFPLGVRNYFRVVPADDLQGAAAAAYAKEIGANSVYVLDDTELYGHGIAVIFAQSARDLGLQVVGGPEGIDVRQSDYSQLADKIMQTQPDLVYFGGISDNHPALVLRDLRNAGFTGVFMGADGIADNAFIERTREDGSTGGGDIYSTLVGLPASKLTGAGASWYARYTQRYPNDDNRDFAPFGYEAAKVALSAIERAGKKDREAIRAAVAQTGSDDLPGDHILGEWQFDANGDTSLVTISVQKQENEWVYQGVMQYDPETKRWTFER